MAEIRNVLAPAKINLSLNVLSRRPDGYHAISSVMQAIDLCDEISVRVEEGLGCGAQIRIEADDERIPTGPENLAYKAAMLVLERFCPDAAPRVHIHIAIKKKIPMAAGLAGGTSDAAAVILALASLFGVRATISALTEACGGIGADAAFCLAAAAAVNPALGYRGDPLAGTAALAEGIGELLTPATARAEAAVLLVKPRIEVSTAEVYKLVRARGSANGDRVLTRALDCGDAAGICAAMHNDLEAVTAAAYPVVQEVLDRLRTICDEACRPAAGADKRGQAEERAACVHVQMSGSGPTVFAYFPAGAEAEAEEAWHMAEKTFPNMEIFLCSTL
jgi:4-diphosphocytidyl-2-C-methyl-D-erythritol kinase